MNARTENGAGVKNSGNAGAEELYRKYGPMVMRRCSQMLGDDAAADAVQDIFVKLMSSRELLNTKFPSSLLWTMATNYCLNALRDRARRGGKEDRGTLLDRIASSDCDNNIEERIGYRGILDRLFGRHPASSRAIAVMHLVDDMTLEETARETGMSVSGVRKRLRALKDDLKNIEL